MALAQSNRTRVGLLTAGPAHGGGAGLAIGLLQMGLLACVYVARHGAPADLRGVLAQHLGQALTTPRRYFGALGRAVASRRLKAFSAAVRLAMQARRDGVTHLHACDDTSGVVAAWAAGFLHIGFSSTLPARVPPRAQAAALVRELQAARFVRAASDAGAQAAAALAPHADLRRAYPGVDYRHFSPRLRRPSARVPLVLAVAADDAGVGRVVEACARLTRQGQEVRFDIVCDPSDAALAQGRVEQAGLRECMRVLGKPGALADRLTRAALYLQLVRTGDDGTAADIPAELLQAMAMGLPVLAESSPPIAECITPRESGWLIPAGDTAALLDALQLLLTTPRLGEQLGKQARERVLDRFDAELNLRSVKAWLDQAALPKAPIRPRVIWQRRQTQGLHHA